MKLALIPPLSHMAQTARTKYQLVLPELFENTAYCAYVDNMVVRDDYIILDNGAAEDEQRQPEELLAIVEEYGIDEMAIPDVLGDVDATLNKFHLFFEQHEEQLIELDAGLDDGLQLGYVAQGTSVTQSLHGIEQMFKSDWSPYVGVIYIPRLLVARTNDSFARLKIAREINTRYGARFDIHLFGAAPLFPSELLAAASQMKFIRGMDTSMPFNFAHAYRAIDDNKPEQVHRPKDYFNLSAGMFSTRKLDHNLKVILSWARGEVYHGGEEASGS